MKIFSMLIGWLVGSLVIAIAFFKGKNQSKIETKGEQYDDLIKTLEDNRKHQFDSMDNIRQRMSKYARGG